MCVYTQLTLKQVELNCVVCFTSGIFSDSNTAVQGDLLLSVDSVYVEGPQIRKVSQL